MSMASKIEDASVEAAMLNSLLFAVTDSLYNGSAGYEQYEWAFTSVSRMAGDLSAHLDTLTKEAYEELKMEKEAKQIKK